MRQFLLIIILFVGHFLLITDFNPLHQDFSSPIETQQNQTESQHCEEDSDSDEEMVHFSKALNFNFFSHDAWSQHHFHPSFVFQVKDKPPRIS